MSTGEHLINWYEKNKRQLPWREDKDPYKIWLSEIILQQTRVEQGMPYYLKFVESFPDVFTLAASDEQDVLKLWEGLGYYSRARNMLKAAKQVCEEFNGHFPADYQKLLGLKGIGDYTAAAIASIAFDLPHAVVDGNVQRVISRLYNLEIAVDSNEGKKIIKKIAEDLLVENASGKYNQAIMELGAMICKPANPNCPKCPINHACMAFKNKNALQFPIKQKKIKQKNRFLKYLIIIHNDAILLQQRPKGDIWQGLWEPILIEGESLKDLDSIQLGEIKDDSISIIASSEIFMHQLTHQKLHIKFHICLVINIKWTDFRYQAIPFSQLGEKPFPIIIKKYLNSAEFKHAIVKCADY